MAQRLEIGLKPTLADPAGRGLMAKARDYLGLRVADCRVVRTLTFDTALEFAQLERAGQEIFTNPVTEMGGFSPLADQLLPGWDWLLWVGLRPGVRDNEGATAAEAVAHALGHKFADWEAVYSSRQYVIKAPKLTQAQAEAICVELLANPLINAWRVIPAGEWDPARGVGITIPRVDLAHQPKVHTFQVASDAELLELSAQRDLFLNPADVPVIRAYFDDPAVRERRRAAGLGDPTDVELEYVSQARSDHCNHNTFGAKFHYFDLVTGEQKVVENLFKETIKRPTEELAADRDWVVSVLWDNAGVARLDESHNYCITAETHNSPSNMEAYGGALTGIVGVYRDPMGTGLGSKLVAGMWGFCVGPRDYAGPLKPLLHPRRLLDGVIEGVRDGGNKSGIPTSFGCLRFDERYLGKCLVFVGAVGIMPKEVDSRPSHLKTTSPGELIVMCGGRVGADGIHGVTASSAGFSESTPAGHVQIGDPYTQKKMHDFLLEARDAGLVQHITDNGGGGLSSSIGESARLAPGAEVDLGKVPLKYAGLDPWQIWVSESQERMTVSIRPQDEAAFMALAAKHEVEATVIGRYTGDGWLRLTHGGQTCCYVEVEFLEKGFPQWTFTGHWTPPAARGLAEPVLGEPADLSGLVLDLVDSPNLCSRQWINRQFDHEVQGSRVLGPFCGVGDDVPVDASVYLPVLTSRTGLAMTQVLLTEYGDIDTYHMVRASVEEGFRRVVAAGGDPRQVGGLDNFCWPGVAYDPVTNPDGRYKAAQLVRACWGLQEACSGLGIPLLSGKDSMYVDGRLPGPHGLTEKVSGPPTMMFTAVAPVKDIARVQSPEPKAAGDHIYMLGETRDELGGSAFYGLSGLTGLYVPRTDLESSHRLGMALARALEEGILASVMVLSQGGLAYALARSVMAAGLGMEVDLDRLPGEPELSPLKRLFSESTGRVMITAAPGQADRLAQVFDAVPLARIGKVIRLKRLQVSAGGKARVDLTAAQLRRAFTRRWGGLI